MQEDAPPKKKPPAGGFLVGIDLSNRYFAKPPGEQAKTGSEQQ
jgi:hypothetical protein